MNKFNTTINTTCQECGDKVEKSEGHIEDYGVTCHNDCLTDELTKQLQSHFYADTHDRMEF